MTLLLLNYALSHDCIMLKLLTKKKKKNTIR